MDSVYTCMLWPLLRLGWLTHYHKREGNIWAQMQVRGLLNGRSMCKSSFDCFCFVCFLVNEEARSELRMRMRSAGDWTRGWKE